LSIIRKAIAELRGDPRAQLIERLSNPQLYPFLEDAANELLDLCHAGRLELNERELAELVQAVSRRRDQLAQEWWARHEEAVKAAEAEQARQDAKEAAVARIWGILGWGERSPDGSGPIFPLADPG
jgi:hypothetical protein